MSIYVNLVSEDDLSEYILIRLLKEFGSKYEVANSYGGRGFGYIKSNINGFNQACIITPFLVLTDLDNNQCPLALRNSWFQSPPHPNMIFRIAVREVEAWLLADKDGFSRFVGVSKVNFPDSPEMEIDPKRTLINLTQRSRKRSIREDIVPINQNARIGANYNGRLIDFVMNHWDISKALKRSESLKRAYNRLQQFEFTTQ